MFRRYHTSLFQELSVKNLMKMLFPVQSFYWKFLILVVRRRLYHVIHMKCLFVRRQRRRGQKMLFVGKSKLIFYFEDKFFNFLNDLVFPKCFHLKSHTFFYPQICVPFYADLPDGSWRSSFDETNFCRLSLHVVPGLVWRSFSVLQNRIFILTDSQTRRESTKLSFVKISAPGKRRGKTGRRRRSRLSYWNFRNPL